MTTDQPGREACVWCGERDVEFVDGLVCRACAEKRDQPVKDAGGDGAVRDRSDGTGCPADRFVGHEVCPVCGGERGPSGTDGGCWIHLSPDQAQRQRERRYADVLERATAADLRRYLAAANARADAAERERDDALRALTFWENEEARICPEDFGFEEYIGVLVSQRDRERAAKESVCAAAEEYRTASDSEDDAHWVTESYEPADPGHVSAVWFLTPKQIAEHRLRAAVAAAREG